MESGGKERKSATRIVAGGQGSKPAFAVVRAVSQPRGAIIQGGGPVVAVTWAIDYDPWPAISSLREK